MLSAPTIPLALRRKLQQRVHVSPADEAEFRACSPKHGVNGFLRFLSHCLIQDKATRREVPFDPFEGQRIVIPSLVDGTWLVLLKGRQLGLTWLCAAYSLWRITYHKFFVVSIINQERDYAEDFIWRVRFMYDRLPRYFRKRITTDNKQRLTFQAHGNDGQIRAMVGSAKAGRSVSGDLVIIDEASRVPELESVMQALQPQINVAAGQIIQLSSSAGPQGIFYETWVQAYGEYGETVRPDGIGPNGFKPIFLHWSMRPGRDEEWYAQEVRRLGAIGPVAIKQEYPNTPQEAWEYASGRVYPLFSRDRCVGDVEIPTTAERYRAIDWGESKSAQVCLWIAYVRGNPGFLVSPACPNTIREFFAYRWDPDRPKDPLKEDDHTCDALRYAVMTFRLTGLVYVYRELYVTDSLVKGWSPMRDIKAIHEASGWVEADPTSRAVWRPAKYGELYDGTVADRSWGKMIALFNEHDLGVKGHKRQRTPKEIAAQKRGPAERPVTEVKEGIRLVSALIEGSIQIEKVRRMDEEELVYAKERTIDHRRIRTRVTESMTAREIREAARRYRLVRANENRMQRPE